MKKLITLCLCIGLLFTTTSCSGNKVNEDALMAFVESFTKLSEVTSTYMEMDVTVDETTMKTSAKGYGPIINDKGSIQAALSFDLNSSGQQMENVANFYLKDNVAYFNSMSSKTKRYFEAFEEIDESQSELSQFSNYLVDFMKPYISSADKDKDVITISLDVDKINELSKDPTATNPYHIDSIKIVENLEKDLLKSLEIVMEVSGSIDCTISLAFSFDQINSIDTIEFPDFSDYTETPSIE